jgi:hypothetical protein
LILVRMVARVSSPDDSKLPESPVFQVLFFQLEDIKRQFRGEPVSSGLPRDIDSLTNTLATTERALPQFTYLLRSEEVKALESQLRALQTDLQEAKHLVLRERIKQAYVNVAEATEDISTRFKELVRPYSSPLQDMASQEFKDAIGPLWIECVAQRGAIEQIAIAFRDQLPPSRLEKRINYTRQEGAQPKLQDLVEYSKIQQLETSFYVRLREFD